MLIQPEGEKLFTIPRSLAVFTKNLYSCSLTIFRYMPTKYKIDSKSQQCSKSSLALIYFLKRCCSSFYFVIYRSGRISRNSKNIESTCMLSSHLENPSALGIIKSGKTINWILVTHPIHKFSTKIQTITRMNIPFGFVFRLFIIEEDSACL